jgi:lysophospholipid hydrolase
LRTEKAINDIACHPLPNSFYEGGGLQHLRQRFDGASSSTTERDAYLSLSNSSIASSPKPRNSGVLSSRPVSPSVSSQGASPANLHSARYVLPAGDLLISQGRNSDSRWNLNLFNSPRISRNLETTDTNKRGQNGKGRVQAEDFDLREEVMSCIAKSIGLSQPPLSGSDSVEASPALQPSDRRRAPGVFDSPFGTLSLLDLGDDVSSATGSSSVTSKDAYMSGLNNEVEILFFSAGTTLVKAGEHKTGITLEASRDIN